MDLRHILSLQIAKEGAAFGAGMLSHDEATLRAILEALPQAIYTTDASGKITYYNAAAAALWGMKPELGKSEFCGSWRLYWPDGTPLPHDECPTAIALRDKRPSKATEIIVERPNGRRKSVLAFPSPLFDAAGNLSGAVNMLVELGDHAASDEAEQRLATVVESSDDAILTKDLNGIITSWNRGAQRLFGYTADEAIGRPVAMLIPADRYDEEPSILGRIRRGERVDHYETIRRRKDGSLIELSLSVSPLRNRRGVVIGASKIARDITERKRLEEQQLLLVQEMNHRIKNLFALASSVVTLSAPFANSAKELASTVRSRLISLARAHHLTLAEASPGKGVVEQVTTLHALITTIVSPFDDQVGNEGQRVSITGIDVPISGGSITSIALLLHEFATNAAKYGALSVSEGRIHITCVRELDRLVLTWKEEGGPPIGDEARPDGFGTRLSHLTVKGQLGGDITRDWQREGLTIRLSVRLDRLSPKR
ncbi:MAG: PAS domain S-box protein [Dongiaceae bacterium]